MKKSTIALFPLVCAAYLSHGIEANVVGYVTDGEKQSGTAVNRFSKPGGGASLLSEIMQDAPLGTEISFFDGNRWINAIADMGTDDKLHWYEKATDEVVDSYEIPEGAGIKYKFPKGEKAPIVFAGEVNESYFGETATMFDGGLSLDKVRPPQEVVRQIIRPTTVVVTNNVVVEKNTPNRFTLCLRTGNQQYVFWSHDKMTICDQKTGQELKTPVSAIDHFEIDKSAPAETRMDASSVQKLQELYLAQVAEQRKKEDAKRVEEGFWAAIWQYKALFVWIFGVVISAIVSYYIAKLLDLVHGKKRSAALPNEKPAAVSAPAPLHPINTPPSMNTSNCRKPKQRNKPNKRKKNR